MTTSEIAHLKAFCLELAKPYSFTKKDLLKNAEDLFDFIMGKSGA